MKKIFTFFAAVMMTMAISAQNTQDIDLSVGTWGWGYDSTVEAGANGGLDATITGAWGAISTGWDPEIDITTWQRIVIEVDNLSGCEGTWWTLKAYLRDKADSESTQLAYELPKGVEGTTHMLTIDLSQASATFDLTKARVLAIQCEMANATFHVARAYFEKDAPTGMEQTTLRENGVRYNLMGQAVGEDYKGIVILNGKKMLQ